jgi:phage terminase small subunit
MPELLKKQRAFVIAYTGEAKGVGRTAAKLAGYTGTDASLDVTASRLLKSDKVLAEIEKIRLEVEKHIVVDRIARRQILSDFAEDASLSAKDRMKAIELLGKMSGDFIERRQVDSTVKIDSTRKELRKKLDDPSMWEQICSVGDALIEDDIKA